MSALPARLLTLPQRPGAYRWLYLDAACGDLTAVVIFMLGAPFSAAYSAGAPRGASPLSHCAVNLALYREGRRVAWVLTERAGARVEGATLTVGQSRWTCREDGGAEVLVDDKDLAGQRVEARVTLEPRCPRGEPQELVPGEPHWWHPVAPRAAVRLECAWAPGGAGGTGYHDANWGEEPLGRGLPRWRWTRTHGPEETAIVYEPERAPALHVRASAGQLTVRRASAPPTPDTRRTAWALEVPSSLAPFAAGPVGPTRVLESSPFYARLETPRGEHQVVSEVADFRRFHHPAIRWMADWRTRRERS